MASKGIPTSAGIGKLTQNSILGNNILSKIEGIASGNAEKLTNIDSNVNSMSTSLDKITELISVQNKILEQIRDVVVSKGGEKKSTGVAVGGFDFKSIGKSASKAIGAGIGIVAMAAAISLAAGIFMMIPSAPPKDILTKFGIALGTVGVLMLMAPAFSKLIASLGSIKSTSSISYGGADISTSGIDIMGIVASVGGAFISLLAMSAGIVASASILQYMPDDTTLFPKLGMAILVAVALVPVAFAFTQVMSILANMKSSTDLKAGDKFGGSKSGSDIMGMVAAIGGAFISLIAMSGAIVAAAYILQYMPNDESLMKKALIAGVIGFAMIPVAFAFGAIIKSMSSIASNPMAVAIAVAGAAIALPLMMGALGLGIHALNATMPDTYPALPEWKWLGQLAVLAAIGTLVFYGVSKAVADLSIKGFIMTALGIPVLFAALATGIYLWNLLGPGADADYSNPIDTEWAFKTAIGLLAFVIPLAALALVSKMGPQALLLGTLGISLLMGAIAAGLWLFDKFGPDDPAAVANTFGQVMLAPFNVLADTLANFMNKIGIENMGPLALGLTKLGAGWAAFVAAVSVGNVAQSIGSLVSGTVDAVKDLGSSVVNLFTGGDSKATENKGTALDLITKIGKNINVIQKAGPALTSMASAMQKFAKYTEDDFDPVHNILFQMERLGDPDSRAKRYGSSTKNGSRYGIENTLEIFDRAIQSSNKLSNIQGAQKTKELFQELNNIMANPNSLEGMQLMIKLFQQIATSMETAGEAMDGSSNGLATLVNAFNKVSNKIGGTVGSNSNNSTSTPQLSSSNKGPRDLIAAIKRLETVMSGTQQVFVVNQEGL
jgi:hypothetical protein